MTDLLDQALTPEQRRRGFSVDFEDDHHLYLKLNGKRVAGMPVNIGPDLVHDLADRIYVRGGPYGKS